MKKISAYKLSDKHFHLLQEEKLPENVEHFFLLKFPQNLILSIVHKAIVLDNEVH